MTLLLRSGGLVRGEDAGVSAGGGVDVKVEADVFLGNEICFSNAIFLGQITKLIY